MGVRKPSSDLAGGGGLPYCPKNYTIPESLSVVQTDSNRSRNKNVTILTSKELVIIRKKKIF